MASKLKEPYSRLRKIGEEIKKIDLAVLIERQKSLEKKLEFPEEISNYIVPLSCAAILAGTIASVYYSQPIEWQFEGGLLGIVSKAKDDFVNILHFTGGAGLLASYLLKSEGCYSAKEYIRNRKKLQATKLNERLEIPKKYKSLEEDVRN